MTLKKEESTVPLADRMRPRAFEEFVGQEHIIGEASLLRKAIEKDTIPSMILWGPPGSGKTTLAHVIAKKTNSRFEKLSAVTAGVEDIKNIVEKAKEYKKAFKENSILFIDEIHRFNKRQQDALLPHVEDGTIVFIGATTENPSFEVISALLSRSRVFVLNALETEDIELILKRALIDKERGLGGKKINIKENVLKFLADMANGDARVALNALELAVNAIQPEKDSIKITIEEIKEALQRTHLLYDKVHDYKKQQYSKPLGKYFEIWELEAVAGKQNTTVSVVLRRIGDGNVTFLSVWKRRDKQSKKPPK